MLGRYTIREEEKCRQLNRYKGKLKFDIKHGVNTLESRQVGRDANSMASK